MFDGLVNRCDRTFESGVLSLLVSLPLRDESTTGSHTTITAYFDGGSHFARYAILSLGDLPL